jgi:hypothetical protein
LCIFTLLIIMKRITIILFAFFYLTVTSGIAVNIHYCGGKIKTVSIFAKGDTEKGCCGSKKKSKGCCKDKKSFHKVKDNHKSSNCVVLKHNNFNLYQAPVPVQINYSFVKDVEQFVLNYHAPPVIYDNPLYLKNRVLLI